MKFLKYRSEQARSNPIPGPWCWFRDEKRYERFAARAAKFANNLFSPQTYDAFLSHASQDVLFAGRVARRCALGGSKHGSTKHSSPSATC